jgi:hypothetical protein
VYPAALRAQKRRLAEIRKREEEASRASLREKRKLALFNDHKCPLPTCWDTEYSRNFPGYDKSEYARSLSARPIRKCPSVFGPV